MELLESQDPEKIKLIETSDRHKRELEKEMKSMTDKTEKVVKKRVDYRKCFSGHLLNCQPTFFFR
jgi:hypothetical protein